jgi:hypothetical protein
LPLAVELLGLDLNATVGSQQAIDWCLMVLVKAAQFVEDRIRLLKARMPHRFHATPQPH